MDLVAHSGRFALIVTQGEWGRAVGLFRRGEQAWVYVTSWDVSERVSDVDWMQILDVANERDDIGALQVDSEFGFLPKLPWYGGVTMPRWLLRLGKDVVESRLLQLLPSA